MLSASVAQPRLELVLLLIFGGIAGTLAIVGIYGVVAYSVAQRTREIGIRMALGAQPVDVGRMVLGEGVTLAAAGITLGAAATLMLTRILRTLLFETDPADPATLGAVVGVTTPNVKNRTLAPPRLSADNFRQAHFSLLIGWL